MVFKSYTLQQGLTSVKESTESSSDTQVYLCKYPVLASNIGLKKMCIHVNINPSTPKALILDLNLADEEKKTDDNVFAGFVDYKNINDVQIDRSNMEIGTCARILFLTSKQNTDTSGSEERG